MTDTATVTDAAAHVRAALGAGPSALPCHEITTWGDDELLGGLVTVEALARQVDAWRIAMAVEVDERSSRAHGRDGLAASRGCRTSRELIRRVTGAAQTSVSRWLRLGRATRESTGLTGQPLPSPFAHVGCRDGTGADQHRCGVDDRRPPRPGPSSSG